MNRSCNSILCRFGIHTADPYVHIQVKCRNGSHRWQSNKDITIVGRGHAVQNLAKYLTLGNATVTVAHSKTKSLLQATMNRDVVIYATPTITKDISYNTRDLVIDLGNSVPHPDRFNCPYVNRIGQLTVSVLLNRFARKEHRA